MLHCDCRVIDCHNAILFCCTEHLACLRCNSSGGPVSAPRKLYQLISYLGSVDELPSRRAGQFIASAGMNSNCA